VARRRGRFSSVSPSFKDGGKQKGKMRKRRADWVCIGMTGVVLELQEGAKRRWGTLRVVLSVYECLERSRVGLYEHCHNDQQQQRYQQEAVTPASHEPGSPNHRQEEEAEPVDAAGVAVQVQASVV
jgi:hypothetical protein